MKRILLRSLAPVAVAAAIGALFSVRARASAPVVGLASVAAPASAAASPASVAASPVSTGAEPGDPQAQAAAVRAERIRQYREEIAKRYADRRKDALGTLEALRALAKATKDRDVARDAEKAVTNLQSGLEKADAHVAAGVFRKAFLALGRPKLAAEETLAKCRRAEERRRFE